MDRKKFIKECNDNISIAWFHYGISSISSDVSKAYDNHIDVSMTPYNTIRNIEDTTSQTLLDIGSI